LPPLFARRAYRTSSQANACHPERCEGSAFTPVGPRANPPRPVNSARCAQPDTPESPQPLFHHALAHSFRHTPGLHPSSQNFPAFSASSPVPLSTRQSPLATTLLISYSYALFCTEQIAILNAFNTFHTLHTKHPGGGLYSPNQKFQVFAAPPPDSYTTFQSRVTNHQSQVTKPFTIRTSPKLDSNLCRMRSFKTQDLKLFRMCSSEKNGGGVSHG
jgi:hypothetical protein